MSLIHQVLKDLDDRREVPAGDLQGYAQEQSKSRGVLYSIVTISLLGLILTVLFSGFDAPEKSVTVVENIAQPLIEDIDTQLSNILFEIPEIHPQLEIVISPLVPVFVEPDTESYINDEYINETLIDQPFDVINEDSQALAVKDNEKVLNSNLKSVVKRENNKSDLAIFTRVTSSDDYYSKAINLYRSGDFWQCLVELNRAISQNPLIKYFSLKQRVFIDQGMRESFLELYEEHSTSEDFEWLSVVAPGLHLFGVYDVASDKYGKLMLLQPENSKWALAQIQAQIDAGQVNKAVENIDKLPISYSLTRDQVRWLGYQREVLR